MRGAVLVGFALLSCAKQTALPHAGSDARADIGATSGPDASGTAKSDAAVPFDLPMIGAKDTPALCSPWPVTPLAEPADTMCPPSDDLIPCSGSGDVGAIVARSADCVRAWGNVLFQCTLGPEPKAGEETVLIEVGDCRDTVDIETAVACADRIELSYVAQRRCEPCAGHASTWRAFTLPVDDRPVVASGRTIVVPCRATHGTGGTTGGGGKPGMGGTSGFGGATGTAVEGGCPQDRIDAAQAAAAYAAYAGLDPGITVAIREETVPGLWDELHAQLFTATPTYAGGTPQPGCSVLHRECVVAELTDNCTWFGPIASGVVSHGAFYYSWGSGSGIYRTTFTKLVANGTTFVKTRSGGYTNEGDGPPPWVIALEQGQLRVYRPARTPSSFNVWEGGDLLGTLEDLADRLVLVDRNGQEVPPAFPP